MNFNSGFLIYFTNMCEARNTYISTVTVGHSGQESLQEQHTPGLPVNHQITAMPLTSLVSRLGRVISRLRLLESPLSLLVSPLRHRSVLWSN